MYGSHDMRHIGFPQVNGGQRDPREMGRHKFQLLSCSPCRRKIISGTGSVREDGAHQRPLLRRKPDCGFDIFFVKHVLKFLILIYVCIKSDVTTLETIVI